MQDITTGFFNEIPREEAETIKRILAAGQMEAPIFEIGEKIKIKNASFQVVDFSGKLLILRGTPSDK